MELVSCSTPWHVSICSSDKRRCDQHCHPPLIPDVHCCCGVSTLICRTGLWRVVGTPKPEEEKAEKPVTSPYAAVSEEYTNEPKETRLREARAYNTCKCAVNVASYCCVSGDSRRTIFFIANMAGSNIIAYSSLTVARQKIPRKLPVGRENKRKT